MAQRTNMKLQGLSIAVAACVLFSSLTACAAQKANSGTTINKDILDLDGVSDELKQVAEFLSQNQEVHLATVREDGNPSIHTFLFCYFTNKRIYFLTSKSKPVYKELTSTETVEFIVTTKDNTQSLTVSGSVVYDETYELIDRALTLYPNIKKIYGSADNPNLTMFYIEHGNAQIFEFSDARQGPVLQYYW